MAVAPGHLEGDAVPGTRIAERISNLNLQGRYSLCLFGKILIADRHQPGRHARQSRRQKFDRLQRVFGCIHLHAMVGMAGLLAELKRHFRQTVAVGSHHQRIAAGNLAAALNDFEHQHHAGHGRIKGIDHLDLEQLR